MRQNHVFCCRTPVHCKIAQRLTIAPCLQVWDVREAAAVRERFGKRTLQNPLHTADFGFATADEAEPAEVGRID